MVPASIKAKVRKALQEGGTIRGIAKELGVTEHTVKVERIKLGGTAPDNRRSNTRVKVQLLTARGWSVARIAKKLHVSDTIVYRYRRENK